MRNGEAIISVQIGGKQSIIQGLSRARGDVGDAPVMGR